MNEKVQKYLESKLLNGEEVLWYGQPPKGFLLRRSDWFYIPSSLIFAFGVAFVDYKMLVQSIYFGLFLNSLFMLISIKFRFRFLKIIAVCRCNSKKNLI